MIAPVIIPASAPVSVIRFQNKESMMSGPNAAPKPAQAYATSPRTLASGFPAIQMARTETNRTIRRPTQTNSFCEAFLRKNAL